MKLIYIGAGFVGACSAAVMADSGHEVLVYDIDRERVKMLGSKDRDIIEQCLFEKGLGDMLVRSAEKISFTGDFVEVERALNYTDAIFMCLPTPEKGDGGVDLSFYDQAAADLSAALKKRNNSEQTQYVVLVNKSTVPIDMADRAAALFTEAGVKNFGVVSNPEFLVEGKAIDGSLKPDRIVIGGTSAKDFAIMKNIYQRFATAPGVQYIEVNPKEAAAGKLLANFLLFSRLVNTYDVVGRVAEMFPGIAYEKLRTILMSDERIGQWGFFNSAFSGGSCFIKDTKSLKKQLGEAGADVAHLQRVLDGNNYQLNHFYERAASQANFNFSGRSVAIIGVAFKRDTNDVRNSAALAVVQRLINDGAAEIRIYDPAAMPMFKKMFDLASDARGKIIKYFDTEDEALQNSEAGMILADWPKFRTLGDAIKKNCPPPYLIMDGRRMLAGQFESLADLGYDIIAVGSPFVKGEEL
ncbi:MAG: nucleotide sugar dehydrogenase [Patescibacteria group bacterium]|nr:nucleotide sugar dehydrogenase [Patescibacteria group bacterium]